MTTFKFANTNQCSNLADVKTTTIDELQCLPESTKNLGRIEIKTLVMIRSK